MTCIELQESLAEIDHGGSAEQLAHLKTCPECSVLVKELLLIASSAAELREADEPSPRVWNSIEIALRQEGLIHAPRTNHSPVPSFGRRSWPQASWPGRSWAGWLALAAALVLIAAGLRIQQQSQSRHLVSTPAPAVSHAIDSDVMIAGLNDDDLLQEVAAQSPAMRAQYADNLLHVNQYIHDAKGVVDANPNDEEARRSLLEAYQQKAMLFELAMDRSLP